MLLHTNHITNALLTNRRLLELKEHRAQLWKSFFFPTPVLQLKSLESQILKKNDEIAINRHSQYVLS